MPRASQFSDEDAEMRGSGAKQVFSLLLILGLSDGFKIVSTSQTEKVVKRKLLGCSQITSQFQVHQPGDTVTLVCRADSYWEYCSWSHKQRKCDLEWKYSLVSFL